MLKSNSNRLLYVDVLRIFAVIGIIILHVSNGLLSWLDLENPLHFSFWKQSITYDSLFKWGTAVFLMISGVFMLKPEKTLDMKMFLKQKITRIFIPLIIWVFLYKFIIFPDQYDLFIVADYFNILVEVFQGNVHYHLWFVYMIFCMYLITPVLSVFLNKASDSQLKYYFVFWFITTSLFPITNHLLGLPSTFETYIQLSTYSGFYMLGYYLHSKNFKLPLNRYLLFFLFVFLNIMAIYWTSTSKTNYLFSSRTSVFHVLNAILVFMFFRQVNWEGIFIKEKSRKLISEISVLSYGVFLSHVMFIWLLDKGIFGFRIAGINLFGNDVHVKYGFPVTIITVTLLSFTFSYLVSKSPVLKKIFI